jgi:hypothetical protein
MEAALAFDRLDYERIYRPIGVGRLARGHLFGGDHATWAHLVRSRVYGRWTAPSAIVATLSLVAATVALPRTLLLVLVLLSALTPLGLLLLLGLLLVLLTALPALLILLGLLLLAVLAVLVPAALAIRLRRLLPRACQGTYDLL